MAKLQKTTSQEEPLEPLAPGLAPARKKRKAKKRKAAKKVRPLPPPIEPGDGSQDPFQLASTFDQAQASQPSASSSTSEPKPGEPLSEKAEQRLREGFDKIGVEDAAPSETPVSDRDAEAVPADGILPDITFDVENVGNVLRKGFHWIAARCESAHWELDESEVSMLAKPTAQVLSHFYAKLPDFLTRWCDTTPGLGALVVMSAIVIGPKVVHQQSLSRERRSKPARAQQPQAVPRRPQTAGPVGEIREVEPIEQ